MPVFDSKILLQDLAGDVHRLLHTVKTQLASQPVSVLQQEPAPGKWSAVQCLDHLNGYGQFYIPRLEAAIAKGEQQQWHARGTFRSGWFGNYFTNLMKPREDGALRSRMKAPAGHRPPPHPNAPSTLATFIQQQEQLLQLLQRAEKTDIARLRVPTSLTSLLKLSVGDTFRFLIAHEQRHILQALRALLAVNGNQHTAVSMQFIL